VAILCLRKDDVGKFGEAQLELCICQYDRKGSELYNIAMCNPYSCFMAYHSHTL
jgi:hypothetical protein